MKFVIHCTKFDLDRIDSNHMVCKLRIKQLIEEHHTQNEILKID